MTRLSRIQRFYQVMDTLRENCGGYRYLRDCSGRLGWPARGVYFFFEPGETRTDSGGGGRVVRVGTHAVSAGSKTTLWHRLSQHRGTESGGGNHRGSVFRQIVGMALGATDGDLALATWGQGQSAPRSTREAEGEVEAAVSRRIGEMPFLWIGIDDEASKHSDRDYIEKNTIGLLSNAAAPEGMQIDPPSSDWLGNRCPRVEMRLSGLWNSKHVYRPYEPEFLDRLADYAGADKQAG